MPPKQYNANGVAETSREELIDRFKELADSTSEALRAGAEKAGELKEAIQSESGPRISDARKKVWDDLLSAFQNIYDLGEIWNDLAPRVGESE